MFEETGKTRGTLARSGRRIPSLREDGLHEAPSLEPAEYARTTCYQAGHLVTKNAGWRSIRPVLNLDACTKCLQCYLYCPDGTVYKDRSVAAGVASDSTAPDAAASSPAALVPAASGDDFQIAIDYDFCKGCGICARICKFDAITMIPESEVSAR